MLNLRIFHELYQKNDIFLRYLALEYIIYKVPPRLPRQHIYLVYTKTRLSYMAFIHQNKIIGAKYTI